MKRKDFIINSALSAVAISTSGFIRFDGNKFIGDCETTTDILGPYYRPDSPVRSNLATNGEKNNLINLSGAIRHKDCITPYKKAKIELWHCSDQGVYDNSSNEFLYRGTTYSDDNGNYSFDTILPVPYDIGGGMSRPAHFHLMVTAAGYQPLVTQLYFSGDAHIKEDKYASSPAAKRRILTIQNLKDGTKKVVYDVGMSSVLAIETNSINKLVGVYTNVKDPNQQYEFFEKDNCLWQKNEAFGNKFEHRGKNNFEYAGLPPGLYRKLHFELLSSGAVQLSESYANDDLVKHDNRYLKK